MNTFSMQIINMFSSCYGHILDGLLQFDLVCLLGCHVASVAHDEFAGAGAALHDSREWDGCGVQTDLHSQTLTLDHKQCLILPSKLHGYLL